MPRDYERLVKKLKQSPSVNNPWALAHTIQNRQEERKHMDIFDKHIHAAKKKHARKSTKAPVDRHKKRELELFLDNDKQMYARKKAFLNAAAKKMRAGVYDHAKAGKLWLAWVDMGAKKYVAENASGPVSSVFSPATREAVANDVARHEYDALVRGERGAIDITPKKVAKKPAKKKPAKKPAKKAGAK